MKERNFWFVKYIITFLVCSGLAVIVLLSNNISQITDKKTLYKTLCDAFCVPGVLCFLFSALLAVSREGVFDGISYALKHAFLMLIPAGRKKEEKYADYKAAKEAGREKKTSIVFLLIIGGAFFVLSLVFLVVYKNV